MKQERAILPAQQNIPMSNPGQQFVMLQGGVGGQQFFQTNTGQILVHSGGQINQPVQILPSPTRQIILQSPTGGQGTD